jgi:hypothetical protein
MVVAAKVSHYLVSMLDCDQSEAAVPGSSRVFSVWLLTRASAISSAPESLSVQPEACRRSEPEREPAGFTLRMPYTF